MMTEEKRIEQFLELQELTHEQKDRGPSQHPDETADETTDEQLQQMLADDEMHQLVQQIGFAKRAFKHQALQSDTPDVDDAWKKFANSHAEELSALDKGMTSDRHVFPFMRRLSPYKIAASFVGILLASSIAYAAIQIVRNVDTSKPQTIDRGLKANVRTVSAMHADTVKTDTVYTGPFVFRNVPLDSMLTTIATAHQATVEFENDAARQLRFHFAWKREDSLVRVVEKLNTFEAVDISIENKKLIVR